MITIFFLLFMFLSIIYMIDPKNNKLTTIMYVFAGIVLILVAGLREKGVDNDYYVYRNFWMTSRLKGDVEYSFYLIRIFTKEYLNLSFQYLIFIFAVLGVSVKLIAIRKLTPLIWASLLIYFSHYYILHEFTQIRIGVATGFVLLSLYYQSDKKYILFLICAGLAVFFHQSCTIVFLFILLKNQKKNFWIYYYVIPFGYLLYFFNTYLNISIPVPGLQDKIDLYTDATESGFLKDTKINPFNSLLLVRIIIFYIMIFYNKKISEHLPSYYLLMKVYAFSIFSFLFLSKIPVFSFRIQELLGVVEIILIPSLLYVFSKHFKITGKIVVWGIALCLLLLDIYYNKYILTS